MKDDIADDLEWPLIVISDNIDGFIVCISKKYNVYDVQSQLNDQM